MIVVLSWSCSANIALAQRTIQDPVMQAWGQLEKVQQCAECHFDPPGGFDRSPRVTEFSERTEAKQWVQRDKHAIARRRVEPLTADQVTQVLAQLQDEYRQFARSGDVHQWVGDSNILSHAICQRLGFDVASAEGYTLFRNQCLTCHGGYSPDQPGSTTAFSQTGTQPGISCIYCHQRGATDDWVDAHKEVAWRLRDPDEKSRLGQRDLVTSVQQASLCLDCHVGNIPKNQFVTHAMYAAGHPPLPSFELQTFCRSMPQHWRSPAELYAALKDYPQRDAYFRLNYPELLSEVQSGVTPETVYWKTRHMLIGSLATRRQWLQLTADAAQTDRWGDYALYDCAACHHELRTVSLRQQRGYAGVPGRPRPMEWPTTIADIAAQFCPDRDRLAQADRARDEAFSRQPFGDPPACREAAAEGLAALSHMLDQLSAAPIDRSAALQVRDRLLDSPLARLVDYQSARQTVWALLVIADEDHGHEHGRRLTPLVFARLKQLRETDGHGAGVSIDLPAGRERFIFPNFLRGELHRQAEYDPANLKRELDALRPLWTQEAR